MQVRTLNIQLLPLISDYGASKSLRGADHEPLEITEEEFKQLQEEMPILSDRIWGHDVYIARLFGIEIRGIKKPTV